VEEARRLYDYGPEEWAICPDDKEDRTAWLVYADWLDEHDFPINAQAVRSLHSAKS
jgi:uncharacterized protein (TIGR02996 family)